MGLLNEMIEKEHEQVVYCYDKETGLKAIIAIHDTTLGPALGGTRFWPYASEEEALYDVMRLSRGMSLKNAGAGLKFGGAKAVVIGDPKKLKSPEFFKAYAKFINRLNGAYITAEDVNISKDDILELKKHTKYVAGALENPAPYTAYGVYCGIKAAVKKKYQRDDLTGLSVAISGLGSVGALLCEMLSNDGVSLKVADIDNDKVVEMVEKYQAQSVSCEDILSSKCDIFAPCALGAVINKENVEYLQCDIIAGCANNVLTESIVGNILKEKDILYIPDYIINAGGVISVSAEIHGHFDKDQAFKDVESIYDTVISIIEYASEKDIPTSLAADEYAMGIINKAKL